MTIDAEAANRAVEYSSIWFLFCLTALDVDDEDLVDKLITTGLLVTAVYALT